MKVDKKNITAAAKFKAVRDQLGFTQQKLADAMLLTRNYVAKIEAGIQVPSPRAVMALESLRASLVSKMEQAAAESDAAARYDGKPDKRSPDEIVRSLRADFDAVLAASERLPQRLHWIAEQMREHLPVPKTWVPSRGAKGVHVTLPSQTAALSAETGKPLPATSRPARSA